MNAVERALRDFLSARPADVAVALVGGLAVSARAEPRFTRDLDFAIAVASDDEAAHYVFRLRQVGYEIVTALEQTTRHRLSTIRLRRGGRGPLLDLLFAACGIETEIVQAAEPLEIASGVVTDVAQVPRENPRCRMSSIAASARCHSWSSATLARSTRSC